MSPQPSRVHPRRDRPHGRFRRVRLSRPGERFRRQPSEYSPDGGEVAVELSSRAGTATIAVRDEGLGIAAAEQERIFEKFYRLDPSLTRGVGGSGLGLYISRELVTRMNGRLTVESRPGVGSTFTVELATA